MTDLVKFVVAVKHGESEFTGLGAHQFRVAPRIGEFVTFDDKKGIGQAYKVKAVIHPLEPVETAGDLILEHIGTDLDLRLSL